MAARMLVIGNKNYSSWSLRPWLLLRQAAIPFQEIRVPLDRPETNAEIRRYSPSGRVPVLVEGDLTIWESLAICEWAAERFPEKLMWPDEADARAVARAAACEMHGGFQALRDNLPMDIRARRPAQPNVAEAQSDIDRVQQLWADCRARFGGGGPFLFGRFGVADAMFAPVATRFVTYGVALAAEAQAYVQAVLSLPAMQEWTAAAEAETEVIDYFPAAAGTPASR